MIRPARGFTLVEAVVAIAIIGIVAGIVAVFLRLPVQGYVDNAERVELADTADAVLRRMAREFRLALPNSIRRVSVAPDKEYIEFLLTKTGGRYLAEEDDAASGNVLSFTDVAAMDFDIVGPVPSGPQAIEANDFIVVYNLGPGMSPADAYGDCTSGCNIAAVNSVAGNTVTLASNPFAAQNPPFSSPGRHFQVVSSPVTYECDRATHTLTRYSGYVIAASQPTPPSGAVTAVLAHDVQGCTFSYDNVAGSMASQRNGLIGLSLTLAKPGGNSGAITLFQQVHTDNTP